MIKMQEIRIDKFFDFLIPLKIQLMLGLLHNVNISSHH